MYQSDIISVQTLPVFKAEHLRVVNGANLGDPLSDADDLVHDDVYSLSPLAARADLKIKPSTKSPFTIAEGSRVGTPGADLHLDCCLTFMSGDGQTTECLVLVETDNNGAISQIYALPLAEMVPKADYVLVRVDRDSSLQRFAQMFCVSFTRGTLITLSSGEQKPVEQLSVGDRVLTRDEGAQEIRWIGQQTVRAVGAFAPICILKDTLNNNRDLFVSPDHRLFIYQRTDRLGAGRSEVLVKARHLVDDSSVFPVDGGFVDYYQMLFDRHQIIYAEGIAVESMLVDTRTRAVLPEELDEKLAALLPGHRNSNHTRLELKESLVTRSNMASLLRKSSTT